MLTCNKRIACTPFESKTLELEVKKGFAVAKQRTSVTLLTVVFGDDEHGFQPGDKVWVKSDGFKTFGKDEYEIGGVPFILVPLNEVLVRSDKAPAMFNWYLTNPAPAPPFILQTPPKLELP